MNSIVQTIPRLLIETKTRSFDKKQNPFYRMAWETILKIFFGIFWPRQRENKTKERDSRDCWLPWREQHKNLLIEIRNLLSLRCDAMRCDVNAKFIDFLQKRKLIFLNVTLPYQMTYIFVL